MAIEPRRLSESEGAGELREALLDARAASGSAERVARLRQRLELGAAAPDASAPAGGTSGRHGATGAAAMKGALVIATLLLGAGATRLGWLGERIEGAAVRPAPHAGSAAPAPRADVAPAPNAQPAAVPAAQSAPTPQQPRAETAPAPAPSTPRRRPPAKPSALAAPPLGSADSETEIVLLTRAEQLIATRPDAALAVLGDHAQRFPHGVLVEEREVLRIDAELALGRRAQAAAHALRFVREFPSSSHRRRLEQLLADRAADSERKPDGLSLPTE